MDIIDKIFSLGAVGSTTIVLCGAMLIAFIGYALGSIKIKGVSLGTAGVFLMALLCQNHQKMLKVRLHMTFFLFFL